MPAPWPGAPIVIVDGAGNIIVPKGTTPSGSQIKRGEPVSILNTGIVPSSVFTGAISTIYTGGTLPTGDSFLTYWNKTMHAGDLPGVLYPNEAVFTGAALTIGSPYFALNGVLSTMQHVTDDIITTLIGECRNSANGGLSRQGAFLAWGDETTTTLTQLRDGYTLNVGASCTLGSTLTSGDSSPTTFNVAAAGNLPAGTGWFLTFANEQMQVTAQSGTTTRSITATRGVNGTAEANHSINDVGNVSNALGAAITTTGQTAITSQTTVGPPAGGFPYIIQIGSEFINIASSVGTALTASKRGASGSTASTYANNTPFNYVWPDPGLTSVVNQAHASGVKVLFLPLQSIWASIATVPQLATLPDMIGYGIETLQDSSTFPGSYGTDYAAIKAVAPVPILVEMNTFVRLSPATSYTSAFVLGQMNQVIAAGVPQGFGFQYQTTSEQCMLDVIASFRP